MKLISKLFILFLISCILFSCGNDNMDEKVNMEIYDEKTSSSMETEHFIMNEETNELKISDLPQILHASSSMKAEQIIMNEETNKLRSDLTKILYATDYHVTDTMKNMLKKADIKFRVTDIVQTTVEIEEIINNLGGYIENSRLKSDISQSKKIQSSADSIEITNYYTATNTIKIRVPNKNFNAALKSLVPLVDRMDYREYTTEDITINLTAKQLARKRAVKQAQRMQNNVASKGNKLESIISAEDRIALREEQEDSATIEMLVLKDKINFSVINLQIYQNNIIDIETTPVKIVQEYTPPFGNKLLTALKNGWWILEEFILFIIANWSIILIFAVIIITGRKYFYKNKKP